MVTFLIELQSMTFVGHLNQPKALAAVGLALVFKYVIADSIMFGMNTGLETLAA
jgi:Na+-driven multidrug efflux pump